MPEKIKMEENHHPEDIKGISKILNKHCCWPFVTSSSNSMHILNYFVGSYVHRKTFYSNNIFFKSNFYIEVINVTSAVDTFKKDILLLGNFIVPKYFIDEYLIYLFNLVNIF